MKVQRRAARHYNTKPFRMKNSAPLVSFTFDDAPDSAYFNGASILEEHGARGTFYIASGLCGTVEPKHYWKHMTLGQVRGLRERGHEIGCHTFSHINVENIGASSMEEECRNNDICLTNNCGSIPLANFAFPYGAVTIARKLQLQRRFDSCRGILEGVNAGKIDLALLKAVELCNRNLTPDKLQHMLRETYGCNGWLIFYTHDVADAPSEIGCTPGLLRSAIHATQAMGLACVTVREALVRIGYSRGLCIPASRHAFPAAEGAVHPVAPPPCV